MASASSPRHPEFAPVDANFERLPRAVHALVDGMTRPTDRRRKRPSLVERAARALVIFCIGVAATLAWQSYGDAARVVIANSSPRLDWVAPQVAPVVQTAPVAQTAPDAVAWAVSAAPSLDPPQLKEVALGLSAVRQSVDQLAAQVAASQQRIAGDIAKLQAEISAPPPRPAPAPAPAPARKPVPLTLTPAPPER
jgi:hypothetical protein